MPYGVFVQGNKNCVYKTDAAGQPRGRSFGRFDTPHEAKRVIEAINEALRATFEVSRAEVATICTDCAEAMQRKGIETLRVVNGRLETKAMASELMDGLCMTLSDPSFKPQWVDASINGEMGVMDYFQLWITHTCIDPTDDMNFAVAAAEIEEMGLAPTRKLPKTGLEVKSVPMYPGRELKADSEDPRVVKQIFAVFGNIDSRGDRIALGATTKTITEQKRRIRVLWQHDDGEPPVGVPLSMAEKAIGDLPGDVQDFYRAEFPEATGVLLAEVKYLATPRGDEILEGILSGALNENSIGYSPILDKVSFTKVDGRRIRELKEIRLWDLSSVNWGANDATANFKQLGDLTFTDDELIEQLAVIHVLADEFKAGRVLSGSNTQKIKDALASLEEILAAAEKIAEDSEPDEAEEKTVDPALTERVLRRLRLTEMGLLVP